MLEGLLSGVMLRWLVLYWRFIALLKKRMTVGVRDLAQDRLQDLRPHQGVWSSFSFVRLTSSRFVGDLSSAKEVDDAFIFGCFL